ncbi:S-adenosyl-l-methionine hydroxide adenosyltransferase family protein [Hymenobacter sp. B81]|uniref:S-adenosyl-l-methionine hydroxide adenosyltransferase family protein n=1 Tax=Hymenobacter sp. B81 TaxID=3344878 RepID=UPI0037DCC192
MGLITFLSDFGYRDHYVAAVKARLLGLVPAVPVLDLTHAIEPYNVPHAVHVLGAVFADFPAGTVHLIGVDDHGGARRGWVAASWRGHYFVAADNGILTLLTDARPDDVVRLPTPAEWPASPTRDVLAPAAAHLAQGHSLTDLGPLGTELNPLVNRQLRLQDHRITGHVVHVDHYGNLVTNITRTAIEAVGHGRACTVHFARESVRGFAPHFQAVDPGDVACVYNGQGALCIGVNQGHASELLGLHFDSQVDVRFAVNE